MDWQVLDVLTTMADDIRIASALAQLNRFAPTITPQMVKEEHQRRDTGMRKRLVLDELTYLQTNGIFFFSERDHRIDDETSIVKWYNEDIIYTGFMDEDGVPVFDHTSVPLLKRTGYWDNE